nr:hypothetical protein [uncultured Sphingobacterium sp.]
MKEKIELKEGFEFLQPDVDAGKYIGEYNEEYGGYCNIDTRQVIMKDGETYCAWKAKEITTRNKVLKEGYEFLQPLVDEGIYFGKYDEEKGGYYMENEDYLIIKDSDIMMDGRKNNLSEPYLVNNEMVLKPYLVSYFIAYELHFKNLEKIKKEEYKSGMERIKNGFAEVLKSEIENNDRLVLTVFNEDEKKERKATRVTLFEEEVIDSTKVIIKTAKEVIDGFISNFIPSGQKCKIAIENIVFENIERKCKHSSCQLEITISVSYQLIDE